MSKVEAEHRWLIASLDPRNPKDRAMLDWLSETTLLGAVGGAWPKPRLVVSNDDKREEVERCK